MPQPVRVVQVFVTQRHPANPLFDQRFHRVFNQLRMTVVREAARHPRKDAGALFPFPQQQSTAIGTDETTVKLGLHPTAIQGQKGWQMVYTVCS